MTKILFLLLSTVAMYGQVPADATPLENIQITNNQSSTTATKVNVQENDGTINTISKSDLVNVVEVNDVPSLPLIGEVGKIYVVKNVNKIYRWNGTFYPELTTDISGKEDIAKKQNNLAVDGTNTKYPTVTAVNTGLALKANLNGVVTLTGNQAINGNKTFNETTTFDGTGISANFRKFIIMSDGTLTSNTYSSITLGSLNGNFGITSSGFGRALLSTSNIGTTARTFTFPNQNGTFALTSDLSSYEPSFTKNTAFNKNFGTTVGTVVEGGTLGTNAYSSTAYLPLSGGTLSNNLTFTTDKGIIFGDTNHGIVGDFTLGVRIFTYLAPNGIFLQQVTGNVGIGTKTPSTKLDVAGAISGESYTATSLPVFENNAAASSLAIGQFYRTSIGVLMVKF